MARAERERVRRRWRLVLAWVMTALIVSVYFVLPDGEEVAPLAPAQESAEAATDPLRLEIVEVTPADASPGAAVTVTYIGAEDAARVQIFAGKVAMEVLARHKGSLVARVPAGCPRGASSCAPFKVRSAASRTTCA